MSTDSLNLPPRNLIKEHILEALSCYWSCNPSLISKLPVKQKINLRTICGPLRLTEITMPAWAKACGVNGVLLVPVEVTKGGDDWKQVDWWLAAFLLLEAWHERVWEVQHGPIHSYCFRLKGWDERAWEHAWVNRIGLFLRQWAFEQESDGGEINIGSMPRINICMTHDVDAITKTFPIRLKQGAFNLFNAAKSIRRGKLSQAAVLLWHGIRFLFGFENWWTFDRLLHLESESRISATYHFYADNKPKSPKRWLFDPGYDISSTKLKGLLDQLIKNGHGIGLHPSFEAWQDAQQIAAQRTQIEDSSGIKVTHCRQHWLRFSWQSTWSAQQIAGLTNDASLMFNDRPGFRNSSALSWHPWNPENSASIHLTALPSVFMDSHFYDYQSKTPTARKTSMRHWFRECRDVCGEIAVLWHPHTLTTDYGWSDGFTDAVKLINEFSHGN